MELSSLLHIEPAQLTDFEADFFVTTLGSEAQCTTASRKLEDTRLARKIALVQTGQPRELSYIENSAYFTDNGFDLINIDSGVPDVGAIIGNLGKANLNMILDCSCMSPVWYYEIFKWFCKDANPYNEAKLRTVYYMSGFKEHEQVLKVKSVSNFDKKVNLETQRKRTALILGLGYEKGVSQGIFKKIKPDLLYLFYADPPADKRTVEQVFVNNHKLINSTPIRNLVAYPERNGQVIYQSLIDTILPLRSEYSIIVVPHGPKFFSVISILIHLGYPDIQVGYPVFKKTTPLDRTYSDQTAVLDIQFEGEE